METGPGAVDKKQATILGLSEEISDMLYDLQSRLDCCFNRTPKEEERKGIAPIPSNILDEIIERLKGNRVSLNRIIFFISSDVLPKIN